MKAIFQRVNGIYQLVPFKRVPLEWVHHQEEPEISDNDKALLFGKYHKIAGFIRQTYEERPCTLYPPNDSFEPVMEGGKVIMQSDERFGLKHPLPKSQEDKPRHFGVGLLWKEGHVILHRAVIHTYFQDKTFSLTQDFEPVPKDFDMSGYLRQFKIDSLLQ